MTRSELASPSHRQFPPLNGTASASLHCPLNLWALSQLLKLLTPCLRCCSLINYGYLSILPASVHLSLPGISLSSSPAVPYACVILAFSLFGGRDGGFTVFFQILLLTFLLLETFLWEHCIDITPQCSLYLIPWLAHFVSNSWPLLYYYYIYMWQE